MGMMFKERHDAGSLFHPCTRTNLGFQAVVLGLIFLCFFSSLALAQDSPAVDNLQNIIVAEKEGTWEQPATTVSSAPPKETPGAYQMEKMVVTGSRTGSEEPEKMAVPVQVVTREELQDIGAVSLGQALEAVRGVELIQCPDMNATPGVQTLRMRGMDANHVLVLINGRRQPGTRPDKNGFAFTDISGINISDVERIEVLRDGASAQYGADAVAGVINIVMKKYNPRFSASTQYGLSARDDAEEKQAQASTGIPVGKKGFVNISANGRKTEHYDRTPENPRWTSPDVDQAAATVSGSLDITDTQILDGEVRYNQTETVMRIGKTGYLDKNRESTKKDWFGSLGYEGELGTFHLESGLGLGLSDTEYRRSEEADYNGDLSSDTQEVYLHAKWHYRPGLTFFAGTAFNRESVDAPYRDFVEDREIYALFGEASMTFFDRLTLTLSGRVEEYSDFGTNPAPKLSARYEWSDNLMFRASVSRSFQAPTLYQLHDRFEDAMGWADIYGNPDLDPAEGVNINGGVVWTPLGPDSLELTADVYRNDIDNAIESQTTGIAPSGNTMMTYVNLDGTSTFKGVEASAGLPLPYGFSFDVTANYMEATAPNGDDLTNRPRSRVNATLSYRFSDRLTANLRYVYRGKYLGINKANEIVKVEGYDFFNAQVTYNLTKSLSLFLGGRNIFDQEPPIDPADYEGGHRESMMDSVVGAYYYGGLRMSF